MSPQGAVRPFERLKAGLRPSGAYEASNENGPDAAATEFERLPLPKPKPADSFFRNGSANFSRRFWTRKISGLAAMADRARLTA
jgi:hypothetical protein